MARVVIVVSDTDETGRDVEVEVKYDPPLRSPVSPRFLTPAEKVGAAVERQWGAAVVTRPRKPAIPKRKPPARRPAVRKGNRAKISD